MPQVNIQLIHQACQDYLNDPILKPFARIDLTEKQSRLEQLLGNQPPEKIIPEITLVSQKKKIVQAMLQAHSVCQVADILARQDHDGITNREFLQKTNSAHLTQLFIRTHMSFWWQELKTSRYWWLLWLAVPITSVILNAGLIYYLGLSLAVILTYYFLRMSYTLLQTYQASMAFEARSQQLMVELQHSDPKVYEVQPLIQLLQQFDVVYDPEGQWLDDVLNHAAELKDKRSEDGSPFLYALLTAQNPNYSYAFIQKLQHAVSIFIDQKYIRNHRHETPFQVLNRSDMYGFKYLLETHDSTLFEAQFTKIDRFLESRRTQRRNTKALLLLEGASGTGKSQTVMDYLGKTQGFEIHRWEAGSKEDGFVGGVEERAQKFFSKVMKQAKDNPHQQFAIYLDNLDVICGTTGSNTQHWMKNLAGQFSHYIDKVHRECPNILVVATTRSALDMDASLLDHSDRIHFPLPNELRRKSLLKQVFIETLVSSEQLEELVQVTEGWSHRALTAIASNLEKTAIVTDEEMEAALEKIRVTLERDFTQLYPHTQIILPKFVKTTAFLKYNIVTPPTIAACLNKLKKYLRHPEHYDPTPMHTLFYGPPGGGKTTAVRNFCEEMNLPFIVLKAGISKEDLSKAFEAVNAFKYALVFIDEIDSFPYIGELLKQMDGFVANNTIVIGATNKPKEVLAAGEGALGDRFHFKVFVPGLTDKQRASFLEWKVDQQLARSQIDSEEVNQLLTHYDWVNMARRSNNLSMRALANHTNSFWGEQRCDSKLRPQTLEENMRHFYEELENVSASQTIQSF